MVFIIFILVFIKFSIKPNDADKLNTNCLHPPVHPVLDPSKIFGKWNQIYANNWEKDLVCSKFRFHLSEDNRIEVKIKSLTTNGKIVFTRGLAYQPQPREPSKLFIEYDNAKEKSLFWILDTDYDNYLIIYSCHEQPHDKESLLILGRDNLNESILENIFNKLKPQKFKITIKYSRHLFLRDCKTFEFDN